MNLIRILSNLSFWYVHFELLTVQIVILFLYIVQIFTTLYKSISESVINSFLFLPSVTYPVFARCSAAVSGQKVNVPCDVSKILETEYGQNWASASLDFNPKSMKNAHDIRKI